VVVQTAATTASTAQPRAATQAAVESVASTFSAVEGALETAVEGALETRAVPKAFSAPVAPPDVVSGVVSKVLASVGLSPSVSTNPLAPVDSPVLSAVLAWARRENQQTPSSFGRLFAVGVSSEEPALAPLNPQALSQDPNAGFYQGISMAYRPIDGTNVDVRDPSENAAGTDFIRLGSAHFVGDDGLRFADLNPRMISNVVVGQGDPTIPMPENFSGMMYAWGQFLDHDLDLAPQDGKRAIDIKVPDGDPVFGDGASIAMTRAVVDEKSGVAINSVTGWLDGSQVYGSTATVAASLRGSDGHLTVENNSLPVVNGQFLAGDVRAAENPSLTALQVLFVREHNSQVDRLHDAHPNWGGDKLYQEARAIVTGELANITYSEFLPKLVGHRIDPYTGFQPEVDATISVEFAGAAFRFGHSIVSGDTERIDNNGNVAGPAKIPLRDTFFMAPKDFNASGGADGFLRHLAAEASQTMDVRIVEDLRNFLKDPPVGMDLAAINIQRGRDLGLGTLNETRKALGLKPYTTFEQITNDAATVAAMKTAFGTPDNVDLWTGGLAEQHARGSLLGPTFTTIIADQFERLRDGDPFYFENALDPADVRMVQNTTLSDIITRNTDATNMQADVFMNVPRGVETETDLTM
jgi:peroxidase